MKPIGFILRCSLGLVFVGFLGCKNGSDSHSTDSKGTEQKREQPASEGPSDETLEPQPAAPIKESHSPEEENQETSKLPEPPPPVSPPVNEAPAARAHLPAGTVTDEVSNSSPPPLTQIEMIQNQNPEAQIQGILAAEFFSYFQTSPPERCGILKLLKAKLNRAMSVSDENESLIPIDEDHGVTLELILTDKGLFRLQIKFYKILQVVKYPLYTLKFFQIFGQAQLDGDRLILFDSATAERIGFLDGATAAESPFEKFNSADEEENQHLSLSELNKLKSWVLKLNFEKNLLEQAIEKDKDLEILRGRGLPWVKIRMEETTKGKEPDLACDQGVEALVQPPT